MATTEEILLGIGIDPASVKAFIEDVRKLREGAEDEKITIEVQPKGFAQAVAEAENLKASILGLVAAGGALTAFFVKASNNAADDEKALKRLQFAFGAAGDEAATFTENLAKASGRAAGDIQSAAANFRQFANGIGLADKQADEFAKTAVRLGVDLGQVTGLADEEVFNKLQAAFGRGAFGAKELGINLDESRLKAQAFADGLGTDLSKLTQAQEAQLKLKIVLQDTAKAAGAATSGNRTFGQSITAAKTSVEELLGSIGKIVNDSLKPFVEQIFQAVEGIRGFIDANPKAAALLIKLGLGFIAVVGSLSVIIGSLALTAKAVAVVIGSFKEMQVIALALDAALGKALAPTITKVTDLILNFGVAATKSVAQAGAFNVALGVLGAAIVGFSLGTVIRQFFDLDGAMARAATGAASTGDKIKTGILNAIIATNPALSALAKLLGIDFAGSAKIAADASNQVAASTKRLQANLEGNKEAQDRYNVLLNAGIGEWHAAFAAVDDLKTVATLHEAAQRGNAKAEEALQAILAKSPDLYRAINGEVATAVGNAGSLIAATKRLAAEEATRAETLKRIRDEFIKGREDNVVASFNIPIDQLTRDTAFLAANFQDRLKLIKDFEAQQAALQKGGDIAGLSAQYQELGRKIKEQLTLANQNAQAVQQAAEVANRAIVASTTKRVNDVVALFKQEAAAARQATDAIINEAQRRVSAIDRALNPLIDSQRRGTEILAGFSKEQEEAALRQRDARLVEIKQAKETLEAGLKEIASQEERARAIKNFTDLMSRLGGKTDELKKLEKELAETQKERLDAVKNKKDSDDILKLAEKEKQLQDDLNKGKAGQLEVEKAIEEASKSVATTSEQTNATVIAKEAEIRKLSEDRLKLTNDIKLAEENYAKAVEASGVVLKQRLDQLERIKKAAEDALAAQRGLAQLGTSFTAKPEQIAAARQKQTDADATLQDELARGRVLIDQPIDKAANDAVKTANTELKNTLDSAKKSTEEAKNSVDDFQIKMKENADAAGSVKTSLLQKANDIATITTQGVSVTDDLASVVDLVKTTGDTVNAQTKTLTPAVANVGQQLEKAQSDLEAVQEGVKQVVDQENNLGVAVTNLGAQLKDSFAKIANAIGETTKKVASITESIKLQTGFDDALRTSGLEGAR